jgi:ankyrin repeat protein
MEQDNLNKLLIDDMAISIARDGGVDTIKMLTSKVGCKINMKNNEGNTMLYYACLDGDLDVVQLLIAKDADINITNKKGLAPIHAACIGNRLDIIEFLVESGVDTTKKTGKSGLTAHDLVEFWNPKDQKSLDLLKSG